MFGIELPATEQFGLLHKYRSRLDELLSNREIVIALTVIPSLTLYFIIAIVPMGWAIVGGFFDIGAFNPSWTWEGLDNYQEFLSDPAFYAAFGRSVIFAIGNTLLQLVLGVGIALLINRLNAFSRVVQSIVLLPYLIPTVAFAYIALLMGSAQWGVINSILISLGVIDNGIAWFGEIDLAMISLIVASSWKLAIFVTIMTIARLHGIPDSLYESATMCGANRYEKFRDITLPRLKNIIFIVLLLRGVWNFNKFDIVWVTTGGGPLDSTTLTSIYAFKVAYVSRDLGKAAAVSTGLFGVLVVAAIIYFRVFEPSKEVRVE